jgi:hypothetical protein
LGCRPSWSRGSARRPSARRADLIDHLAHAIRGLAARYAGTATLGNVRSAHLLAGADQNIDGELGRREETRDAGLRLGGHSGSRGRVEIRHDPAVPGDTSVPGRPGVLVLHDRGARTTTCGWTRRAACIAPSDPGESSQTGTVVGRQT